MLGYGDAIPKHTEPRTYDNLYEGFDAPLARKLREKAYGRDIGQHSWTTAEELEAVVPQLQLNPSSCLLDLGCGPGGPLTFVAALAKCRAIGIDVSLPAIAAARARAVSQQLESMIEFREGDLNQALPFKNASFDAIMSVDVILHVRDRLGLFREARRVLAPEGRFVFTDAGVITGPVSDEEIHFRAIHGPGHFAPVGCNERMLEDAGLHLIERRDCTASLLQNSKGRLAARTVHRAELQEREGAAGFEREQRYLQTVMELSQRGSMTRMLYVTEARSR